MNMPTAYWQLLLLTVTAPPFAFHFSRFAAWDRRLGDLSCPIYISHMFVLQGVTTTLGTVIDERNVKRRRAIRLRPALCCVELDGGAADGPAPSPPVLPTATHPPP
jgi:hypothetical protein